MPTLLGPDTNPHPSTMSGWQVEASPPNAGAEHAVTVRIIGRSMKRSTLTAAGMAAMAAQFATYLTAAKAGAVIARDARRPVGRSVMTDSFYLDVLPEDGPTQIAAICAVLQTAANVTAA